MARSATDLLPHLHPTPHFDIKMLVLVAVKCIIIVSAPDSMLCLWGQWDEDLFVGVVVGRYSGSFWVCTYLVATFWHLFTELESTVFEQMIEQNIYSVCLRDHCKGGTLALLTSQDHSLSKVLPTTLNS